jgi:hypothetical protein
LRKLRWLFFFPFFLFVISFRYFFSFLLPVVFVPWSSFRTTFRTAGDVAALPPLSPLKPANRKCHRCHSAV